MCEIWVGSFSFFVCLFLPTSIHLGVFLNVNPYSNLLKWVLYYHPILQMEKHAEI